jgi:hypothetical protein
MKTFIVLALALVTPSVASANPDLQYALGQLNEAKMYISQGQSQRATNAILTAESSIYRALGGGGNHFRKPYVCAFAYQNQQVVGKGDDEDEARRDLQVNCMRNHPDWTSICDTFVNNPYITKCVQRAD